MKVAIDRTILNKIKNKKEIEYIYIFENESIKDLLKLNMHCIHKDYINEVDINLSKYDINCIKKANIDDKDWYKMPEKKDYKFAIIVPNYNNDHRRLSRQNIFAKLYRKCIKSNI